MPPLTERFLRACLCGVVILRHLQALGVQINQLAASTFSLATQLLNEHTPSLLSRFFQNHSRYKTVLRTGSHHPGRVFGLTTHHAHAYALHDRERLGNLFTFSEARDKIAAAFTERYGIMFGKFTFGFAPQKKVRDACLLAMFMSILVAIWVSIELAVIGMFHIVAAWTVYLAPLSHFS